MRLKIIITSWVVVHLVATLWHAAAHSTLAIDLPFIKNVFVAVVVLAGPVVAAALIWTRHEATALWLFAGTMLGALLFGVYHHYVLVSPDNIHHLPAGAAPDHATFISSAAAIGLLELAGALYGAFQLGLRRGVRGGADAL